jgi:hypothetical protein
MSDIEIKIVRRATSQVEISRRSSQISITRRDVAVVTIERSRVPPQGIVMNVTPRTVWLNEGNGYSADFEVVANVPWTVE